MNARVLSKGARDDVALLTVVECHGLRRLAPAGLLLAGCATAKDCDPVLVIIVVEESPQ